MNEWDAHPEGEGEKGALASIDSTIVLDTFGGRIHVELAPEAAVTPFGQLPFFIEYLRLSGLYQAFVEQCPLRWTSSNAPRKEDVLGTLLLSILSGHQR